MAVKGSRKRVASNVKAVEDVSVAKPILVAENQEMKKEELMEEKKNDTDVIVDRAHQEESIQTIKGQARVAINSMKKFFSDQGSKSLFPDIDHALNMQVVYKKASLTSDGIKRRILLPHSSRTLENTSICLIMPDLDRSDKARVDHDVDKQAREWADKLEEDHGIKSGTHVTKILTYRQLSREYSTFTLKRQLVTAFDLFLVDARVSKSTRSFLGKTFIKAHKMPLEFKYDRPLVTSIQKALKTVNFPVVKFISRASVNCGHLGQSTSHLGENVDEVIDRIIDYIPGGFMNIRSIYLQSASGKPSLPIYLDDGSANDVILTERNPASREEMETKMECSTLPDGLEVAVDKDGSTRVIEEKSGEEVVYPTVEDEWEPTDDIKPKKLKQKRETQPMSLKSRAAHNPKKHFKKDVEGELKEETDDVVVDQKRRKTKA